MLTNGINIRCEYYRARSYGALSDTPSILRHPTDIQRMVVGPGCNDDRPEIPATIINKFEASRGWTYLTPRLALSGIARRIIQPTSCHAAALLLDIGKIILELKHSQPNAPWNPRSRTLSECRMTIMLMMHCRTYGGAVNAFDTKTLKWKDLMTVGRSARRETLRLSSFQERRLQVPSGLVGVRVTFDNSRCPHRPRSDAASMKSARVTRFLQVK